jgi:hypothetical protein
MAAALFAGFNLEIAVRLEKLDRVEHARLRQGDSIGDSLK